MTAFVQPEQGGVLGAPWHLGYLAGFDTETTGTDVDEARIVSAALVVPGREPRLWLADPQVDIPVEASNVHGITTEHARAHGQPAALVIDEIAEALADELASRASIVIMNAPFDLSILDRECTRHGLPTLADRNGGPVAPIVDPLVLDRAADKYRKGKRRLEALCAHYGVELTDAHTAAADAQAALEVAVRIGEKYPELQVDAHQLHAWQIKWHTRWAGPFQEHLRRLNPDVNVNQFWPLIPATVPADAEPPTP
jgi:DNA polymerase-3 subunit epsilon